jgi:histidinol dehydrogenase
MPVQLRKLDSTDADFNAQLRAVLAFEAAEDDAIDRAAAAILADVKARGDAAVLEYTNRYDQLDAASVSALEIRQDELHAALAGLEPARREALQVAADRVRAYHERQKQECGSDGFLYTEDDGTVLGQKVTPLDRVGIYVPGGKAAYPSSVLMNAIPAHVAGVQEIIMVVPTPAGVKNPLVLAAAAIAGVSRVFTIGGAQAVGALAYGTDIIPAVDKIVGPGNAYVAAAKRRVFGTVGIDMIAGPSEILVLCDGSTDPDWVAMDLFSQAEHDELAQSILVCPDADYIERVQQSIDRLLDDMPRRDTIRTSLADRGAMIKVRDMNEACEIANFIAPEHLEISAENPLPNSPMARACRRMPARPSSASNDARARRWITGATAFSARTRSRESRGCRTAWPTSSSPTRRTTSARITATIPTGWKARPTWNGRRPGSTRR